MKIFWIILYNGIIYPLLFISVMVLSVFNRKLRIGNLGRFRSLSQLKLFFSYNKLNTGIYWFHASSLGEFFQLKPIIEGMKEIDNSFINIVSFTSPSGYEFANSDAMDLKIYLPFDFPWVISRALNICNPKKFVFVAYDLWPNFLWLAKYKSIHTSIFATRIKKDSNKFQPFVKNFYKYLYGAMDAIYTITDKDKKLISEIIGNNNTSLIRQLGNPRYDMVMESAKEFLPEEKYSIFKREKRIIIGSSHAEDNEFIIPGLSNLLSSFSDLKVLHVPHEPNKRQINKIKSQYNVLGYRPLVVNNLKDLLLPDDKIVILDVVGILSKLYWQGQIAFIGGGMSTGIHNVMEPAVASLPVLFGPRYDHAPEAYELIKNGGGFCIDSQKEFERILGLLLSESNRLEIASKAAKDVIRNNLGSTSRIIQNLIHD